MMKRLFVYGTLMKGLHNNRVMGPGARLVRQDELPPRYRMVDMGYFPAVLEGGKTAIRGEVWDVPAGQLAAVDQLEGHPRFYTRTRVRLAGGEEVDTYLLPKNRRYSEAREVTSGCWRTRLVEREQEEAEQEASLATWLGGLAAEEDETGEDSELDLELSKQSEEEE